jgi:calcium-dependent protein kinase
MGNLTNRACGAQCGKADDKPGLIAPQWVGDLRKKVVFAPGVLKVGEGSFGQVLLIPAQAFKGIVASENPVAVKLMPRNNSSISGIDYDEIAMRESLVLSTVGNGACENIVRFFTWIQDKRLHCIITEYCSGGELLDQLVQTKDCTYSEATASGIVRQVLVALAHCHSLDVAHLDVKLENLLLANREDLGSLKLIDFGCALRTSMDGAPSSYEQFSGTLEYAAPEVLRTYARVEGDMLKAVDMWSVGVLTHILSTGEKPFDTNAQSFKDIEIKRKIFAGEYKVPEKVSPVLLDFISRLLVVDPQHRMTVVEAMMHPWISRPFGHADYDRYDPMVLAGLRDYNRQTLLKKHVASFLSKSLSTAERERIIASFSLVDVDGSGYLETSEIANILMVALNVDEDRAIQEAKEVFSEFDSNDDGVISIEEFSEVVLRGSLGLDSSRVRSAFRLLDKNNDGLLSKEEIVNALMEGREEQVKFNCQMETFIEGYLEKEIEVLISQADENSDGYISFEEFERSMKISFPLSV